jgi:SulP family sulfate permease
MGDGARAASPCASTGVSDVGVDISKGRGPSSFSSFSSSSSSLAAAATRLLKSDAPAALRREVLAGLAVGIAQVPEAIAFSFAAGLKPIHGLHSSWIFGVYSAVLGARPAQIMGSAGALAVVMTDLVLSHGAGHLYLAIILAGVLQCVLGLLRLSTFMRLVPSTCMMGFCNGLAVLIFLAQFDHFKVHRAVAADAPQSRRLGEGFGVFVNDPHETWLGGTSAMWIAVHVLVTMALVQLTPRVIKSMPSSLVGIAACTLLEHALVRPLGHWTPTIGDTAVVSGSLPVLIWFDAAVSVPLLTWRTIVAIVPTAVTIAGIATIETLMTKSVLDEELHTPVPLSNNRECLTNGACSTPVAVALQWDCRWLSTVCSTSPSVGILTSAFYPSSLTSSCAHYFALSHTHAAMTSSQ